MTEVLTSSPSSSSTTSSLTHNEEEEDVKGRDKDRDQLSLLALLLTLFRKSFWVACKAGKEDLCGMEIGWPTNVRHVAHVTFDRFNGFLGLPVEFEPEVPRRAPSASATVFGVSTESMQLSYDLRGNSVPTILLQMQQRLYAQGGLQAEGIFRINGENSQEEFVRNQLNRGVVPEGIDVHCLAGLIKAWFRELPTGVLDPLAPEQVMQCQSEEDCSALVRILPQTESALLDWAINLMADVVQHEHLNKMNAHNIAMVFAPNMTQMADPLTALMYAVQVMNFLKTLITKTLREREDCVIETTPLSRQGPSDENGHQGSSLPCVQDFVEENEESEKENDKEKAFVFDEPELESSSDSNYNDNYVSGEEYASYFSNSTVEYDEAGSRKTTDNSQVKEKTRESKICQSSEVNDNDSVGKLVVDEDGSFETTNETRNEEKTRENKIFQLSDLNDNNSLGKLVVQAMGVGEKSKGISNLSRINSRTERIEAW